MIFFADITNIIMILELNFTLETTLNDNYTFFRKKRQSYIFQEKLSEESKLFVSLFSL